MRLPIAILAVVVLSAGVAAQTSQERDGAKKGWTAAPVPGALPQDVTPADRAGNNAGPAQDSPFSGIPTGGRTGARPSEAPPNTDPTGLNPTPPNLSK